MTTFRQSQIGIVLSAIEHINSDMIQVRQIPYSELKDKLKNFVIGEAKKVEILTDGSVKKPVVRTIMHSQPISKNRFFAMIKQVYSLEEIFFD